VPIAGTYGRMSRREEVGELMALLEQQRSRLAELRIRARRQSGPESERLEEEVSAQLWDVEQRINDLRAFLE
jgi:hypothetical protein